MYSAAIVTEVTGATQRCLDYWIKIKLVKASGTREKVGSKRRGRGDQRIYTFTDIRQIKLISQLRQAGLRIKKIKKALAKLRQRNPRIDPFNEVLITDGNTLERVRSDGKVEDLLADGQLVFAVVALPQMERELRSNIKRLTGEDVQVKEVARPSKSRARGAARAKA